VRSAYRLSVLFILSDLAMGVPAVVAGWRLSQGGDILAVAQGFDGVVLLLAVLALLGTFVRQEAAAS
jgi:hypothetical protein